MRTKYLLQGALWLGLCLTLSLAPLMIVFVDSAQLYTCH